MGSIASAVTIAQGWDMAGIRCRPWWGPLQTIDDRPRRAGQSGTIATLGAPGDRQTGCEEDYRRTPLLPLSRSLLRFPGTVISFLSACRSNELTARTLPQPSQPFLCVGARVNFVPVRHGLNGRELEGHALRIQYSRQLHRTADSLIELI